MARTVGQECKDYRRCDPAEIHIDKCLSSTWCWYEGTVESTVEQKKEGIDCLCLVKDDKKYTTFSNAYARTAI